MTKKDYILIAEVIKLNWKVYIDNSSPKAREAIAELTNDLICSLEKDNPKFNRQKFYKFIGWIK